MTTGSNERLDERSQDVVAGGLVVPDGIEYYRIDGVEAMAPFLMTVVSDADLWMFVSSAGALTAGRIDADHALFPYETDDRLHRSAGITGPITMITRTVAGERELWQPFARVPTPRCRRAISKSVLGNRLRFEEHRPSWALTFRATWAPSATFGWVRTVELRHDGSDADPSREYEVLDGLLDVMPAGVDALTEQIRSNLVDAYKRSETGPWGPLAVYSLESQISDRAEPLEALTATVAWSCGFPSADLLLDAGAVDDMVAGRPSRPTPIDRQYASQPAQRRYHTPPRPLPGRRACGDAAISAVASDVGDTRPDRGDNIVGDLGHAVSLRRVFGRCGQHLVIGFAGL